MKKYLAIFKISFEQELVYKINFLMSQFRNLMQFVLLFFLWDAIFSAPGKELFGYDRSHMLTYIFAVLVVRSLVPSAKIAEVAGEIARGDLSNYLIKPVNYFKYWITRDISGKLLNITFTLVEFIILFILLKPNIFFQGNLIYLSASLVAIVLAMFLYILLYFIVGAIPFWMPEMAWGSQFLFIVVLTEFLSGSIFPIDIFPVFWQKIMLFLPFPYLIFFPIKVYLGTLSYSDILMGLSTSAVWVIILTLLMKKIWSAGLKVYQAVGR